jgi:N,N-dimethylformamidase
MPEILAYADKISLRAGDTVKIMASGEAGTRYKAELVRLLCAETGSNGPGLKDPVVPSVAPRELTAERQPVDGGSYVHVPAHSALASLADFTAQAFVWPTRLAAGEQVILGTWSELDGAGFALMLDGEGRPTLRLADGRGGRADCTTGVKLVERSWCFLAASYDSRSGAVRITQESVPARTFHASRNASYEGTAKVKPAAAPRGLFIAGSPAALHKGRLLVGRHFNGKIDRPALAARVLDRAGQAALAGDNESSFLNKSVIGAWDFAAEMSGERAVDRSGNRLHGRIVNQPTRAVTGHNWTGAEMNFAHAPEQYSAIYFHDDDLADCEWETSFELALPKDLKSGVYAVRLSATDWVTHVTIFVRPALGAKTAPVALLASTATYLAYSNQRTRLTPVAAELYSGAISQIDATDIVLLKNPDLSGSTYDRHSDGTGIAYSSRYRPVLNLRPTGRHWNFVLDLLIVDWLEQSGVPYDVVTEEDVHLEGLAAIGDYKCLIHGSHPEYDSREMLDAFEAHLRRGGRMMYLGGNGFYWRIAHHPTRPGILEVRRSEDGTRAWAAEVGEYYHSFTGEYGGLWRRQGRAPNVLFGIGFIAQGFDAGSHYRRTTEAKDPRVSFMFKGVKGELIGDKALLRGGAAGLEVDCYDASLGSPRHALVVARSEDHSNSYQQVNEDVLVAYPGADGPHNAGVRADMTFFETEAGGAVFSVGSIAYPTGLSHNKYENDLARLTTNVLKRFADPVPFEMPRG